MRFDIIVGNPPYQEMDGGGDSTLSSKAYYNEFVSLAIDLNPKYITMIIPSRWFSYGKGVDEFRRMMLNCGKISRLVNYCDSTNIFEEVNISGGVCYFLWDKEYNSNICAYRNIGNDSPDWFFRKLNKYDVFIKYNRAISILKKVQKHNEITFDKTMFNRDAFGIKSTDRGKNEKTEQYNISCKHSFDIVDYFDIEDVKNQNLVGEYKVIVSKLTSDKPFHSRLRVLQTPNYLEPGWVCTESYNVMYHTKNEQECKNCVAYFYTKFARFLILMSLSGINISSKTYQFLPIQDFSISWTDRGLYEKYDLNSDETDFIESLIRIME